MRQHAIDLMPAAIRAQSQAGMRRGRFIVGAMVTFAALAVAATHSRLTLSIEDSALALAKTQAEEVYSVESQIAQLRDSLGHTQAFIELYQSVAYPMDVSSVIATVVNTLPESITLDQLDVDAGAKAAVRSPRSKGLDAKEETPARVLTCEVSGFAASDEHIAELVGRLEAMPPFHTVSLDFSRTKKVNDRDAREFRLSFKIDLNQPYVVAYRDDMLSPHRDMSEGIADAQ